MRLIPPIEPGPPHGRPVAARGMRIGLFGGSFNPAHEAHLAITLEALKRLALHRVWWLVSPQNPLKPPDGMAPLRARLAGARRIARDPRIVVSDFEARAGTVYSADTARLIATRWPRTDFVWIAGGDVLAGLHRWRFWRRFAAQMPLAFFDRPGFHLAALNAPAAIRLRRRRLDESDAARLAATSPPCWCFIHGRRHPLSATDLRGARKMNG